ncbi:ras-related protein Rab-38-like [Babylonia areolata]|uniref:ras-related protein Rab-38-like n=1 Tax=Babylonia areolata TaxID=304850 RepID=UPI003FD5E0E4
MAATSAASNDSSEDLPTTTQEHLYKILVIGEFGVGKTSIIRRYTEGYFTPNYKLTIGVDFALKTLDWDDTVKVNLQLWDIAGHERFGHMTRVYYKYAIAAIVVYDVSRPATFDAVLKWLYDVNSKVMLSNEKPVPVLLLANKCDIEEAVIDRDKVNSFCEEHNFIGWFPTSAKSNTNIDEAMKFLVEHILSLPADSQQVMPDKMSSMPSSITSSLDASLHMENKDSGGQRITCCKV